MKTTTRCWAALALAGATAVAGATPVTMSFTKAALGGGLYQYNFALTLDNHDGTWVAGQQWDWIIFGDGATHSAFDTNGASAGGLSWNTLSTDPIISAVNTSSGGHNGPTLYMSTNGVALPGWMPTAIGDMFQWSGTSMANVGDGQMRWSSLIASPGAAVSFERAVAGPPPRVSNVPEPTALALVGVALAALALARRPRRAATDRG